MKWEIINPATNENIIYTATNKTVLVSDLIREEEKNIRVKRLLAAKRKIAFNQDEFTLLHSDRKSGLSIRALAKKYNKSTRTIQKYLKLQNL